MNPEPFASSTISLVLAWLFAMPALLGIAGAAINMLLAKADADIPRWFLVWVMLSIVVFSPFRYIILQLIIGSAYPVQSLRAFVSVFFLGLYVPVVFGLLYAVGVGLPLLL